MLASAEQHRPWREDDGVGHENDGRLGRKPTHAAERQLEAVPEPEEQHVDVLQVIPHPYDFAAACSNSHHLENSEQTRPEPKRRVTSACSNFFHLDAQKRRGNIIWSKISNTTLLPLSQCLIALRVRLGEIALRAVSRRPCRKFVSVVAVMTSLSGTLRFATGECATIVCLR